MNYVMVPVPEHHAKAFNTWLLQVTMRAALASWNPERLKATAARLDEDERRIVQRIAQVRGFWLDAETVADDLGLDVDDLLRRVHAMNHDCYEADTPGVVMVRAAEQSRNGRAAFMMDGAVRDDLIPLLD